MATKVRAGRTYRYDPCLLDKVDGRTNLKQGDVVRVVNLPGCPRANTMGHAHVENLDGTFAGLVCTNSLQEVVITRDGNVYTRNREVRVK